ncbi:hypothetical protein [Mycobacterium sp. RTGN5]|uniref:hypothetical protein n=1 Tax=Mycobacterium sp. RTGN5 TaxID=3016522 RepID=UPI0029C64E2F|nr:hypothetical protein [Mycobacterium sp. RTGN5]
MVTTAAGLGVAAAPLPDRFRAYEVSSAANTLEIAASAAFTGCRGAADADTVDFAAGWLVTFCVDVEGLGFAFAVAFAARGPAWPPADAAVE